MDTIEDIIKDTNSTNEKESYNKIYNIILLKNISPKVLTKVIHFISPQLKSQTKKIHIWRLWNYITKNFFDEETKINSYFKTFLISNSTNSYELEEIEYNLNIAYTVLENCDEEEIFVLFEIHRISLKHVKLVIKALAQFNYTTPTAILRNYVHYHLLPDVFSKTLSVTGRLVIRDFIHNFKIGAFVDNLSLEEKIKLKNKIINVYLPAIAPENDVPDWWNYCNLLIHYCGKFLHTEIKLTNAILRRVEFGFQVKTAESRSGSYECWKTLIKNYNEDPAHLHNARQISLLLKPLKARFSRIPTVSMKRFEVFAIFISYLDNSSDICVQEFLNFCFGPFGVEYKRPCDLQNQHFPGRLTKDIYPKSLCSLLQLIGHVCQDNVCYGQLPKFDINLKTFLKSNNVDKYGTIFIDSITVCSLLMTEWMDVKTIAIFIKCVWTELFSIIKESHTFPIVVLRNIVQNIKIITKAILTYNMFENTLNHILKVIVNYIGNCDYNLEVLNEFLIPLIGELYTIEIKQPGIIKCECNMIFNYAKDHKTLYTGLKPILEGNSIPTKSSFTLNLFKYTVINIGSNDSVVDLLLWLLDNDCEICVDIWKIGINRLLLRTFPALKDRLIDTIKEKMLSEKHLKNINILKLLEVFFPFIVKRDQVLINNIIVSMRYSFLMLPKEAIYDNINILQKLVDIKWKMNFDNNSVFYICFVDLLKQEVFSVLPVLKHFIQKLSVLERKDMAKLHLQGVLNNLVKNDNQEVSSEASSILKLLDDPVVPTFFSRGAKIRNMITNASAKKTIDLSELSDEDFVKIDAEVFVDPKRMSEHQKEVASRRRDDIPALYEDLTQSSMDSQFNLKGIVANADGDNGEDKKRKRDEESKDDDQQKHKRERSDLVPTGRNSLLSSKNTSTPISNRTQNMFDKSLITSKQKSPKSVHTKLETKTNIVEESLVTTDESNKNDANKNEEDIKNVGKEKKKKDVDKNSNPLTTNKKDDPLNEDKEITYSKAVEKERNEIEKTIIAGVKENFNNDVEKNIDKLATTTNKKRDNDKEENTSMEEVKRKRGRPRKSLSFLKEDVDKKYNLQDINEKEDSETNKEPAKKKRGRSKAAKELFNTEDTPPPPQKIANKKDADTSITEQNTEILQDSDTEIIDAASDNCKKSDNKTEEDSSKENSNSNRLKTRALSILKMNIVGGDEFHNLPRKRNSNSNSLFSRQSSDIIRTKQAESEKKKIKEKVAEECNKNITKKKNESIKNKKLKEKDLDESNKNITEKNIVNNEIIKTKQKCTEEKCESDDEKKISEGVIENIAGNVNVSSNIKESYSTDEIDPLKKNGDIEMNKHLINLQKEDDDNVKWLTIIDEKMLIIDQSPKLGERKETDIKKVDIAEQRVYTRKRSIAKQLPLENVDVKNRKLPESIQLNFDKDFNTKDQDQDAGKEENDNLKKNEVNKNVDVNNYKIEENVGTMKIMNNKKLHENKNLNEESTDVKKIDSITKINMAQNSGESLEEDYVLQNTGSNKKLYPKQKIDEVNVSPKKNSSTSLIQNINEVNISDDSKKKLIDDFNQSKENDLNAEVTMVEAMKEEIKMVIFDKKSGKILKTTSPNKNKTKEDKHAGSKVSELSNYYEENVNNSEQDNFEVTSRSETKSGISLTIKKLSPKQSPEKTQSPMIIGTTSEEDSHKFPSFTSSNKSLSTSVYPKLNDVRVALFRNDFNELSPEKIKEISHLNEVSPSKEADTETMEVPSQDSDVKISEAETETMNISEVSNVSLNLVIEKTPDRNQALLSSPISQDTPTRNSELMNSTLNISPIKSDGKKQKGKISPDIFASQKEPTQDIIEIKDFENEMKTEDTHLKQAKQMDAEIHKLKAPSSRSAKLLNLVPQAQQIKMHKSVLDPVTCAPQVSSPTTERIKRMMMNCEEQNQAESAGTHEEPVVPIITAKNILKFEKEVPSPLATPKVSILKRKLTDVLEEGLSPCAKRKRVKFSDPPTTSEKIYFKEIEENSNFKKTKRHKHKLFKHKNIQQKKSDLMLDGIHPLTNFTENVGQSDSANSTSNANSSSEIIMNHDEDVSYTFKVIPQVTPATTEWINMMDLWECYDANKSVSNCVKQIPRPLETLKISVHKSAYFLSKRKRVNFSDPPTTSEKIYFKEDKEKPNEKKTRYKCDNSNELSEHRKKPKAKENSQAVSESPLFSSIKPLEELVSTDRVFHFTGSDVEQSDTENYKALESVNKENTNEKSNQAIASILPGLSNSVPKHVNMEERKYTNIIKTMIHESNLSSEVLTELAMGILKELMDSSMDKVIILKDFINSSTKEDLTKINSSDNSNST